MARTRKPKTPRGELVVDSAKVRRTLESPEVRKATEGAFKRFGRPTKPPVEGERVSLGLRVTARVKRQLEAAAIKNGRSISQEAEMRLEMSLRADQDLILTYGGRWLPVLRLTEGLNLALPISWDAEWGELEEDLVPLRITTGDLNRVRNFFRGAPPPFTHSNEEIEEAGDRWQLEQDEIKRGK